MKSIDVIRDETSQAITELIELSRIKEGQLLLVGCSTSEIGGEKIGTDSHMDIGEVVFEVINDIAQEKGIRLAFQCCEHLNRAIIMERRSLTWKEICNVVPQQHAGGATATQAYAHFEDPVVVEFTQADAGIDIGDTFIGMHLKHVAVPLRLCIKEIGDAHVSAARVRPKSIGGIRAIYDESLL